MLGASYKENTRSRSGSEMSPSEYGGRSSRLPLFADTFRITVIGSLNMDHIWVVPRLPEPSETLMIETYKSTAGGKGAIQAIACARLSRPRPGPSENARRLSVRSNSVYSQQSFAARLNDIGSKDVNIEVDMIGAVGSDTAGRHIVDALKANGVITKDILKCDDVPTGTASIALENSGENNVLVFPGANHRLTPDQIHVDFSENPPQLLILQMEIPMPTVVHLIKKAARYDVPVLLNAAPALALPRDIYPLLQHLIVNKLEAEDLLNKREEGHIPSTQHHVQDNKRAAELEKGKQLCKGLLDLGVSHVVVTMGASGGVAGAKRLEEDDVFITEYAAEEVDQLVDSTGCGGVFIGAYAVEYIRQRPASGKFDITRAVKWAAKAAAAKAQQLGSLSGIPWVNDIDPA